MKKILWLDVETTGFSSKRNGIISIAAFAMVAGDIKPHWRFVREMNPVDREIEDGALTVNGFTRERIAAATPWTEVAASFVSWLGSMNAELEDFDPFNVAGYVVDFDVRFIENWLETSNILASSWMDTKNLLDVHKIARGCSMPELMGAVNHKLVTVVEAMKIPMGTAHTAEADILATIEVYKRLLAHQGKDIANV